jgi:fatty acid desaturase
MSEELRLLLRNALYMGTAALVYWFVSYEWAGTVMMTVLVLGALFFVFFMLKLVRSTGAEIVDRSKKSRLGRALSIPGRLVGFREHAGETYAEPLAVEEGQMPHGSIWPFITALAIALIGSGFIFGPWLWIFGLALGIWAFWGWFTQLSPARPQEETDEQAEAAEEP